MPKNPKKRVEALSARFAFHLGCIYGMLNLDDQEFLDFFTQRDVSGDDLVVLEATLARIGKAFYVEDRKGKVT